MKTDIIIKTKITLPKELEYLTVKEIERVLRNWYGRKFKVENFYQLKDSIAFIKAKKKLQKESEKSDVVFG